MMIAFAFDIVPNPMAYAVAVLDVYWKTPFIHFLRSVMICFESVLVLVLIGIRLLRADCCTNDKASMRNDERIVINIITWSTSRTTSAKPPPARRDFNMTCVDLIIVTMIFNSEVKIFMISLFQFELVERVLDGGWIVCCLV